MRNQPQAAASARAHDRAEATRRHILDVAARAFAHGGYAGTSLNDLIRESGVTKGGFYFHFPSKEALALAVVREKQEQWAEEVMAAAGRHEAAIDRLAAMPAALVDLYEADPAARAVPRLTVELAEDARLAPDMRPMLRMWVDLTASVIRSAQEEGAIRDDVDATAAAEGAVGAFLGLEQMAAVDPGEGDLRRRVERFASLYLMLLRPPDP
ncbi:MAG: ScbR family autoregulator-binding transcription factor, partial [Actinomycetota bacterium]